MTKYANRERCLSLKNIEKREAIVNAALVLIAENGFHEAPMAMIANKAGVGTGTIYCHFKNQDILIQEVFSKVRGKIINVLLEGYSVDRPIRERFMHLGTRLLKYLIEHPVYFRFIEQYVNSPYGVTFRREKFLNESSEQSDVFEILFDQGLTQHIIKDFPLPVHFALAFGPIISIARDHVLVFVTLDATIVDKIIAACWDSINRQDVNRLSSLYY